MLAFEIGFPASRSNRNGFAHMRKHCGVTFRDRAETHAVCLAISLDRGSVLCQRGAMNRLGLIRENVPDKTNHCLKAFALAERTIGVKPDRFASSFGWQFETAALEISFDERAARSSLAAKGAGRYSDCP